MSERVDFKLLLMTSLWWLYVSDFCDFVPKNHASPGQNKNLVTKENSSCPPGFLTGTSALSRPTNYILFVQVSAFSAVSKWETQVLQYSRTSTRSNLSSHDIHLFDAGGDAANYAPGLSSLQQPRQHVAAVWKFSCQGRVVLLWAIREMASTEPRKASIILPSVYYLLDFNNTSDKLLSALELNEKQPLRW